MIAPTTSNSNNLTIVSRFHLKILIASVAIFRWPFEFWSGTGFFPTRIYGHFHCKILFRIWICVSITRSSIPISTLKTIIFKNMKTLSFLCDIFANEFQKFAKCCVIVNLPAEDATSKWGVAPWRLISRYVVDQILVPGLKLSSGIFKISKMKCVIYAFACLCVPQSQRRWLDGRSRHKSVGGGVVAYGPTFSTLDRPLVAASAKVIAEQLYISHRLWFGATAVRIKWWHCF